MEATEDVKDSGEKESTKDAATKTEESKDVEKEEKTNKQSFKEMITYYIKQIQKNRTSESLNKYYNENRAGFINLIVEDEKIANQNYKKVSPHGLAIIKKSTKSN